MLKHLFIKNYALIQQLELHPSQSLNIITGETGAGKSIILGAVNLLLGQRADAKSLYQEDEKCSVEGHFDISQLHLKPLFDAEDLDYDPTCIIRREINSNGKSRAFVNDTPVTLESLKKITEQLVEVHSQHETLTLGSEEYQLQLIDTFAQNKSIYNTYNEAFKEYTACQNKLKDFQNTAKSNKLDFDYFVHQYKELSTAKLQPGQLEKLESTLSQYEHAEEIVQKAVTIDALLHNNEPSALSQLEQAQTLLGQLIKYDPAYQTLKDRLQSTVLELKDIANDLSHQLPDTAVDQTQIELIRQQLNLLNALFQKHQVRTIAELLDLQQHLKQKIEAVENVDEDLKQALKLFEQAEATLQKTAQSLSESRQTVVQPLCLQINQLLDALGMPNAKLVVHITTQAYNKNGQDRISFMFSANKGIAPLPLKQVASGGEFSRLMLAIKYSMASKRALPTLIFDEVDTGVSGEISIKVGKMLREMSQYHQVLAITHLHHIAAQGQQHYFVYKENSGAKTSSNIKTLNKEERIVELAQMIGGAVPSESVIQNAKEMLAQYEN
jgi:DNA repair protein RecN (Recombination protein N)